MSKIRKILIALLAACMTVCAGFALAACKNDDDPFKNPDENGDFKGYVVSVESRGGLGLNNVKVTVEKDGQLVDEGISTNGKITFDLTRDEYDIVVDESSLPAGYSVSSNTVKTSAENSEVKIIANSKVIKSAAPAGTSYKKGDVMYDFSFKDALTGETYMLSEELDTAVKKKYAVMLNLWGTNCNPCVSEFPAIQKAYESYSEKLEIFALSSYGAMNGSRDTDEQVISFKTKGGYTFPMAVDYGNIYQLFNVSAYPTTIIIDRYGVVAYISSGSSASESAWKALFNKYTAASYSQSADITGGENDGELVYEERPEGLVAPDAAAIENALAGENTTVENGFSPDDKLVWPWKVEEGYLSVTNTNAGVSYSVVRFDIRLRPLEGIRFSYKANTYSAKNVLRLIVDGQILWEFSEDSDGWQSVRLPAEQNSNELYYSRSSRIVRVTLMYEKIDVVDETTTVSVDDFTVYDITKVMDITDDFALSAVDGLTPDSNGKYGAEGTGAADEQALYYYNEEEDLYYTYYTDDKNVRRRVLLVADLNQVTAWTDLHYGDYYFNSPEENSIASYSASLYQFSYWFMSNWKEASTNDNILTTLNYDPENIIFLTWQLQLFSDSGYVPVNKKLRNILFQFTKEAYKSENGLNLTDEWYEDQWLELCYYFRHYGDNHPAGENCFETYNTVKGLAYDYAYNVSMEDDEFTQTVTVEKALNYFRLDDLRESGGGIKFKFTPEKSGIYLFYSTHENDANADPRLIIIDLDSKNYLHCTIADNDEDPRYDKIYTGGGNFYYYVVLQAGHTYGITATISLGILLSPPFEAETYDLHVEFVGDYAEMMRAATSGGGFWTWVEDENGNIEVDDNGQPIYHYVAVATILVDGKYYVKETDSHGNIIDASKKIYIDFVNPTYYQFSNGQVSGNLPLRDLIYGTTVTVNGKVYTIDGIFGSDTDKMKAYYEQAIANKVTVYGESEPLTGLLHATAELVNILSRAIGESVDTSDWEQFACYIQTYTVR